MGINLQGQIQIRFRPGKLTFHAVQQGAITERLGEIGIECESLIQIFLRIGFGVGFGDDGGSAALIGDRQVGVQFQCLVLIRNHLIEISFGTVGESPVAVGCCVFRIGSNGAVKARDGFIELPAGEIGDPSIIMGFGVISFFK